MRVRFDEQVFSPPTFPELDRRGSPNVMSQQADVREADVASCSPGQRETASSHRLAQPG
jgi:hypothetical protein